MNYFERGKEVIRRNQRLIRPFNSYESRIKAKVLEEMADELQVSLTISRPAILVRIRQKAARLRNGEDDASR